MTIIWPFKSFMRPVLPLAGVGGTNKLCRIPTAFTPRREKRAFTGPTIILHLLPLHSNTTLDLVVKVQIVESECGGRVYCVFGAKGLTPGSPRALPPSPTSHPPAPNPLPSQTPLPSPHNSVYKNPVKLFHHLYPFLSGLCGNITFSKTFLVLSMR